MNTDRRKKAKTDFFKLMNNAVFGKTMENVKTMRKPREIKLVTTEKRRNYLVSEPNYHTTNFFTEHMLAIEIKKTEILMNKPVYLRLSILELSKVLIYEFWYDYVKPKYGKKAKLCYTDTDSFIVYTKADDIYKDISGSIETRFNTINDKLDRPLPKEKNKTVIGLMMKDALGGKIMTKFIELRPKFYRYLIDSVSKDKKVSKKENLKLVSAIFLKFIIHLVNNLDEIAITNNVYLCSHSQKTKTLCRHG